MGSASGGGIGGGKINPLTMILSGLAKGRAQGMADFRKPGFRQIGSPVPEPDPGTGTQKSEVPPIVALLQMLMSKKTGTDPVSQGGPLGGTKIGDKIIL